MARALPLNPIPEDDITTTVATEESDMFKTKTDEAFYVEDYHVGIKITFALIGCVSLVGSTLAIIAMRRTKKTPKSARFLATCLLTSDNVYVVVATIRKFILHPVGNSCLYALGNLFLQLSFTTIAIMTFERVCVFYRPMRYRRILTERRLRCVVFAVWCSIVVIFLSVRYGACYIQYRSFVMLNTGPCINIMQWYYTILMFLDLIVILICNILICMMIRKKRCKPHTNRKLTNRRVYIQTFKTTTAILFCSSISLFTSLIYIAIKFVAGKTDYDLDSVRIHVGAFVTLNCLINPFLYVLWFQECKREVLKLFPLLCKNIDNKLNKTQMDIFNVVITERAPSNYANPGYVIELEHIHIETSSV